MYLEFRILGFGVLASRFGGCRVWDLKSRVRFFLDLRV